MYDVTPYVEQHMGGDAILKNAGRDSSQGFHGGLFPFCIPLHSLLEQHAPKVQDLLWEFYIGDLVTN